MTNEFECPQFQVSQKMWLTESPEDLFPEKSSLSCKSEKFLPFNFQLVFFSCLQQVSRQRGSAAPSACPVYKVTSRRKTITPPPLSHEDHLQFYIHTGIYDCLCFGPVLSLSQKVSSSPTTMTASVSSVMIKCLRDFLREWSSDFEKQNQFMLSCVLPDYESIVVRSPIRVRKQIVRVIHSIQLCQS